MDLIKSLHYITDLLLYTQKIGKFEIFIAGITKFVKNLENIIIKNPKFTNLQYRVVIKNYNSVFKIKIRKFKICQFKKNKINRNLRNAEIIFN